MDILSLKLNGTVAHFTAKMGDVTVTSQVNTGERYMFGKLFRHIEYNEHFYIGLRAAFDAIDVNILRMTLNDKLRSI